MYKNVFFWGGGDGDGDGDGDGNGDLYSDVYVFYTWAAAPSAVWSAVWSTTPAAFQPPAADQQLCVSTRILICGVCILRSGFDSFLEHVIEPT